MRLQITIPSDLWEKVKAIAHAEHRSPRQQIEFMIYRAVSETEAALAGITGRG
ncbi:MAG TPA: hypothetical protein VFA32_03245 [Dehalococcoidia bacterium]|jgi:hypothetical protein|nr:hypothetical protein [Dehalococcoidia bacterium]